MVSDSRRTITYAYDSADRLTTVNYGGETIVAYTYDPSGNLVGMPPSSYDVYLPLVLCQSP